MDILIFIIILFVASWIPKCYKWIKFKNKYPIFSSEPPSEILEVGDIVCFGDVKKEFQGVSNTDGLWYVFLPENTLTPDYMKRSEVIERMDAIYGRYGVKWVRTK